MEKSSLVIPGYSEVTGLKGLRKSPQTAEEVVKKTLVLFVFFLGSKQIHWCSVARRETKGLLGDTAEWPRVRDWVKPVGEE